MPDFIVKLIDDARKRIRNGYYNVTKDEASRHLSLAHAIRSAQNNAIIAEIKPVSPSRGPLRPTIDPVAAAVKLEKGGAVALSVLTEPDNFGGNLNNLRLIRRHVSLPLLMKDIIVDEVQVNAAKGIGADSVLLIESIFSKHGVGSLDEMIRVAHENHLEVLLEVHSPEELGRALKSGADVVGINNRNLATLEIDLSTTIRLATDVSRTPDKIVISESGLQSADDIRKLKPSVVDGFLIGSSIMLSEDMENKVREFVLA